jgi:hypothetical protein
MSEGPYTETEKRIAKALKRVLRDDGHKDVSHSGLLRVVHKYIKSAGDAGARGREQIAVWIYVNIYRSGEQV